MLQYPLVWQEGQQWGKRLHSTEAGHVMKYVAPEKRWDKELETLLARVQLCGDMLAQEAGDQDRLMAIMIPSSATREFLHKGRCGNFSLSRELTFSQMERAPHFIVPARANSSYLHSWNAVSKFISATETYQFLEAKYLRARYECPDPDADSSAVTLYSQSGTAFRSALLEYSLRWRTAWPARLFYDGFHFS